MLAIKKKLTVEIKYYYQNNQHSYKHETIITSFTEAVSKVIELPKTLEICLYPLPDNVYGGIDMNLSLIHISEPTRPY